MNTTRYRGHHIFDGLVTGHAIANKTDGNITMEVDHTLGTSPPAGTVVTNQEEYDALVAGFASPYLKYSQDVLDILPPTLTDYVHVLLKAGEHYSKPNAYIPDYSMSNALFLYGKLFDVSATGYMHSATFGSWLFARSASIYFEGEWQVDDAEQAGSSSGTVLTRDTGTWGVGAQVDRFVRITSGAGAGGIIPVVSNDITTVTLLFAPAASGVCQFEIISTASIMLSSTDGVDDTQGMFLTGLANGQLWFDKIQFGKPTKRLLGNTVLAECVMYYCRMYLGSTTSWPMQNQGATFTIYSYGIADWDGVYAWLINERYNWMFQSCLVRGRTDKTELTSVGHGGRLSISSSRFEAQGGYVGAMVGLGCGGTFAPSTSTIDGGSTASGVEVHQDGALSEGSLIIDNCTTAIDAKNGSMISIGSGISGSGNTTAWRLTGGAEVSLDQDPALLEATNEIDIDGEVLDYDDAVPDAGDYVEGAKGSRLIRS